MHFFITLTLFFCLILITGNESNGADPFAPADITVTDTIVTTGVEPIGANLTTITGGTNHAVNNHVWNSGFEPIVLRKFIRINRAGPNWFEWDQEGGARYYNLAWTGLFNGASVRFYRIVDSSNNALSYAGGTDMSQIDSADHVIFLGESTIPLPGSSFPHGGYIANDDVDGNTDDDMERVYIERSDLSLQFGDYAYIKLKTNHIGPETSPPDLRQYHNGLHSFFSSTSGEWSPSLVSHPLPLPAGFDDPGETCLQIDFPNSELIQLGQWVYHPYDSGEGLWYSQLRPGAPYRVSVWLRQQGLGNDGKVRVRFNGQYSSVSQTEFWNVTDQWQQFTYDFIAPPYPATGSHIAHHLEFTGPGSVWIDNFVLFRNDEKHEFRPHTPHEVSLDTMLDSVPERGKKPAMRFYGTIFHDSSIESMFTDYGNTSYRIAWNAGVGKSPSTTISQVMYWAYKTGLTPSTRMVPYLTCSEEYTEDEWKALIEYLGVPYDPLTDTPQSKPYAYLRYKYRNDNGTPWTEEFREIIVEYGNETWHNGAGGYGWHGWGRPGYVHQGGVEFGLFAKFMFNDHVMQMEAWDKYNLGSKIKFALGGNYSGDINSYVESAVQQADNISYAGHANYVGPKWETGDTGSSVFDDHGIQMTLLGLSTRMEDLVLEAETTRNHLNSIAGKNYTIIAYEGGPSGYWTNGRNSEVDENYGKSVAMGVAALDTWLYSSLHGFTHQAYLGFSSGRWWSSHTPPEAGGYIPHPGWLTLKLRNRFALGENMLQTIHHEEPTIHSDGTDYPLISSYAFSDGNTYSVFVLSRKLDGNHDGVDFGDGYTPVTLRLPFSKVYGIKRYRLEAPDRTPADPRVNNRSAEQVVIGEVSIPAELYSKNYIINQNTGGGAGGIPPGSANLFVFQTRNPSFNILYMIPVYQKSRVQK